MGTLLDTSASILIWQRRPVCLISMHAWMGDVAHAWFVSAWNAWRSLIVGQLRWHWCVCACVPVRACACMCVHARMCVCVRGCVRLYQM